MKNSIFLTLLLVLHSPLALSSVLLEEYGAGSQKALPQAQTYTLTSWNIYKGQMEGLHAELAEVIAQSDFVNIQEFLLSPIEKKQMQNLSHLSWSFAKSFMDGSNWTGVTTISAWKPYEALALKSPDGQPFTGTPKMSVITKFKLENGTELWIANTHALNFNLDLGAYERQIDGVYNQLRNHTGPIIFSGDFNTWMPGRWDHLLQRAKDLGMTHLELDSPSGVFGATMDHIFYRGLSNVKGSVLNQYTASDHAPLRIEFSLVH